MTTQLSINSIHLEQIAKDKMTTENGGLLYMALFADPYSNASVVCVKEEGGVWQCEAFKGSGTFGETTQRPVGKFRVDRLSPYRMTSLFRKSMIAYNDRVTAGNQRLVYGIK